MDNSLVLRTNSPAVKKLIKSNYQKILCIYPKWMDREHINV
jgi:hypothetical protein